MKVYSISKSAKKELCIILRFLGHNGRNIGVDAVDEYGKSICWVGDTKEFYSFSVVSSKVAKEKKTNRVCNLEKIELEDIKNPDIRHHALLISRIYEGVNYEDNK